MPLQIEMLKNTELFERHRVLNKGFQKNFRKIIVNKIDYSAFDSQRDVLFLKKSIFGWGLGIMLYLNHIISHLLKSQKLLRLLICTQSSPTSVTMAASPFLLRKRPFKQQHQYTTEVR